MSQNKSLLRVENLSVVLEDKKILSDISFSLEPQEVLAIIGPNGSGKSVLLKTLVGLIKPSAGKIEWAPNIRIGYLPQRFQVDRYLPMTVKEFLSLKPNPKYSIDRVIELIGVRKEWQNKKLAYLSGGEIQKALLAWCLIDEPHILLFDEPTENVDVVSQESIYNLLHNLQDTLGIGIVLVSHDLQVVCAYANHVLCLNHKMICYGEPERALSTKNLSELYGAHAFFHHHKLEKHT